MVDVYFWLRDFGLEWWCGVVSSGVRKTHETHLIDDNNTGVWNIYMYLAIALSPLTHNTHYRNPFTELFIVVTPCVMLGGVSSSVFRRRCSRRRHVLQTTQHYNSRRKRNRIEIASEFQSKIYVRTTMDFSGPLAIRITWNLISNCVSFWVLVLFSLQFISRAHCYFYLMYIRMFFLIIYIISVSFEEFLSSFATFDIIVTFVCIECRCDNQLHTAQRCRVMVVKKETTRITTSVRA